MNFNKHSFFEGQHSFLTSVQAIKGIANLAAVSGSTSQQASTAMYQLSQAISSGTVKIQDWNSVVTAGMGGQVFTDALKETARVHGIAIDTMIMEEGSFRETLKNGWLTSELLTETLSKFTGDLNEEQLRTMGYTEEQITSIIKMGKTANDAATKVKTFTQLFDTLKEAAQSGWTQSWEIIIGDFEEAKELLTEMSDVFGGIIEASADSRNEVLFGALTSGWKQLLSKGIADSEGYKEVVQDVAKEHGISVDEMIESAGSFEKSLKSGWLTADILSESLSKLTVKTSGLSDEELKASGYTRKQIDALESLNAAVQDGSISLDEFADKMAKSSGRENLIAALKNSFEGLISVITPIKDAFQEIFPPLTADRLYALTEGLKIFTEKLKIGDETADKIKRTFSGLFALLDIGKQAFSFLFGKVGELVGVLAPGAGGILNFTAAIGDFIVKLNDAIKSSDLFNAAFDKVKNFIIAVVKAIKDDIDGLKETTAFQGLQSLVESAADKIKEAFNKIKDVFAGWGGIDLSGLKSFTENAELHFRPFTALGVGLSKAFDFIVSIFKKVQPFFATMATVVGDAFKKLSGAFKDGGIQGVVDLINGGIFTVILLGIKHFIDTLSDVTSNASGILEGITGILDGVKGSLEAYQNSLKAKTLITIAGAVALLAAALVVLSMIEAEKLMVALGAMTVIFIELAASMIIMQKAMGSGKMIKVSTTMIAMAAAILILSVALKSLAELDWDGIVRGATGIGILMIELQAFINNVKGEKLMSTSIAMIAIGAAMKILASAVADLGELDIEVLMKGIAALGLILGEMIIFINLIHPEKLTSTSIAMIAIGAAMKILASAVADLGALDIPTLAKGLTAMGVILAEIGVFATLIEPTKLVSTGIAMIAIGASMLIFSEAIGRMGSLSVEEIAKGLITMAGALTIIVAATTLMPSDMGGKAAAMLVISAALVVLSQAMQNMGGMTWEEVAKSLVTLAASLTIITIAMQFMTGGLAGAAAMLVMANALLILTPALMMLGSMDLDEIGKALLALVGVFAVVGVSGALLAPLVPAILGLSGAIALLGVGVLAIGAGLLAFSAGLTALGIAGTAGAAALVIVVTSLLSLIPMAIEKLGEGVVAFAGVIKKGMPAIMEAVKAIFEGLILLLVELTPPFLDAVLKFLDETLYKLVEYVPKFVDAGLKILIGLLKGISDNIEEVIKVAIDIVVNLLKGIAGKIPDVIKVGVDIVVALIKAIGEETPRLIAAGFQMIIDFINGLAETIREKTPLLVEAFWNLSSAILEGLTGGLFSGVKGVVDAIVNVGKAIINGFKNLLGINSPSKVFIEFAGNIIKGLVNGIGNGISSVISKAKEIGSAVIDTVKNKFSEIGDVAGNIVSGLANGLKNGISNIAEAAKDLGSSALEGIKNFLNINSPSKKFEEVGEYSGEGMVVGFKHMIGAVKNSAASMGKTAITALGKAMEKVSDLISGDIDLNPAITPVLDFSMIENGLGRIDKMLSLRKTISLDLSNVYATSNSSNARVVTERQIKAQNQQPPSIVNQFDCTGMVVRSDKDIDEIATKLYQKQQAASRGKGVRTPVHIH